MLHLNVPDLPNIAILAPGLLGASLGAASRKLGICARIDVWARREETREACARLPWCDAVHERPQDAVVHADLVWVCSPVASIPRLVGQIVDALREGAVVSDVGSTKDLLVRQCEQALGSRGVFVGSHPMAGSEKSGLEWADAALFEGRACFVTPGATVPEWAVARISDYWRALGMRVSQVSPAEHDRIVALVSHLPHLMASALAACLGECMDPDWKRFAGPGLRDTTRVASGSVDMWRDIAQHNRVNLDQALMRLIGQLEFLRTHLSEGRIEAVVELLEQGKCFRDSLNGA
jgi:prephenate dehydrogenase